MFLVAAVCCCAVAEDAPLAKDPQRFLSALEGSWKGQAVMTPIGPRPYDLNFERGADGLVSASSGESTVHYWTFYRQENDLVIRFLSTFGGNREPILLYAAQRDESGILFRANNPELLSVRVSYPAERLSIDVFHWDQPHVSIRLTRDSH